MPQHAATTSDREHVRAEAHLARTVHSSRNDISKLALELLRQRLSEQRRKTSTNKLQAMASLEEKHSTKTATLRAKYDEDITELEDAKFTLFKEFDTMREAWTATTNTLLEEAGSKHAGAVETLMAQKMRGRSAFHPRIAFTVDEQSQALEAKRSKKDLAYTKDLATLDSKWKLRQLELKKQQRPLRIKIEDDYQVRLGELHQNLEIIRQRQNKELELLEREQESARSDVLTTFEAAEAELNDECQRVQDWWNQVNSDAATRLERINADEESALRDIDHSEKTEAGEAEYAVPVAEAQTRSSAGEVDVVACNCTAATTQVNVSADGNTVISDEIVPTTPQAVAVVEMATVADVETLTIGDGDHISATSINASEVRSPVAPPTCTTGGPPSSLIAEGSAALPSPVPLEVEGCPLSEDDTPSDPDSPFIHVEINLTRTGRERSSLPDIISSESDFVEI